MSFEQKTACEGEARPQDSEVSRHHTTECNDFTWNTLPYYITASISQGLLSLCLSMSACCQLLFKKQHTLSDMHTYQDPYSVFTAFIPRSFLFVRGCANAPRQATGRALCAPKMARAHNARTTPKTRCRIPPGDT